MKNKKMSREEKTDKLAKMWEDGWEEWPAFEIEKEEDKEEEQQLQQGKHRISEYLHKDGKHAHGHSHGQRRMIAA